MNSTSAGSNPRSGGNRARPLAIAAVCLAASAACGGAATGGSATTTSGQVTSATTPSSASPTAATPVPTPTADQRQPITASPLKLVATPPELPEGYANDGADPLSAADASAKYGLAPSASSLSGYLQGAIALYHLPQRTRLWSMALLFGTAADAHEAFVTAIASLFHGAGEPVDALGDEGHRGSSPASGDVGATAVVTWRDRNVVSVLILSGTPADVTVSAVTFWAERIEGRIAQQ